jgi:hypothetical protein
MKNDLSKSKLMAFLQCPRRLYLQVHEREHAELSGEDDPRISEGKRVGEVARSLHPDGVLVEDESLSGALKTTRALLSGNNPRVLFEPAIEHDGVCVRADMLVPAKGRFDLIEVKSATAVKEHYYTDVAIQAFVLERAGLGLRRLTLQHINKDFVYPGGGRYHEVKRNGTINSLFVECDVTKEANSLMRSVSRWARDARKTLNGKLPPRTSHCADPVPCEFLAHCYPEETKYPISCLPRIKETEIAALARRGYQDIRDIPSGVLRNATQEWVRAVTVRGRADLRSGAREALSLLPYPRYYFDFETINFAVPIWKGTRPYQQIPFQWSCHIEQQSGTTTHEAFLDIAGEDPSRALAKALLAVLKRRGPILVYNKAFESRVLDDLAVRFPDLSERLQAVRARLVDLLPIARKHYYHPAMRGSWSIKAVLPTIGSGLDYGDLCEVQDGGAAQTAYLESIAGETTRKRKQVLKNALLEYCKLDTLGMVALARFLEGKRKGDIQGRT